MFLGLYPIAFALKLFPTGDTTEFAPMWIIFLCGIAFVIAGTVILVKRHSRIHTLLVTSILFILGAVGVWVALFSPEEWFVGGFTVLSELQNIVLARWMFGIGAIASFIMSGYGTQQFLLSLIHPHRSQLPVEGRVKPPHPSKPHSINPRLGNSYQNPQRPRRRGIRFFLKQIFFPRQAMPRQYRHNPGRPKRSSRSIQADYQRSRSNQASMPPRRR
ncbi:MAG: hypothetical protein AAGD25_29515 [Cyanobacteria bacterium P01_F01_bin.150]